MSLYKYLSQLWKKPKANFGKLEWRNWLVKLRKEPAVIRVEKPTRLDRARALGYKAKQGFVIVRSRAKKGMRKRPTVRGGRRPKRYGRVRFSQAKSKQRMCEERAARRFPNLEVLNSYWVADDSKHIWYEIIFVDPAAPTIRADRKLNWICFNKHRSRVYRGLVHK
jgi:large subunit ribosomal protein L15e